jgi:hypothetical protein
MGNISMTEAMNMQRKQTQNVMWSLGVLALVLAACTAAEADEFFGPIQEILVESESAESMLCCGSGAAGAIVSDELFTYRGTASSTGRQRR